MMTNDEKYEKIKEISKILEDVNNVEDCSSIALGYLSTLISSNFEKQAGLGFFDYIVDGCRYGLNYYYKLDEQKENNVRH